MLHEPLGPVGFVRCQQVHFCGCPNDTRVS
jgi:hypothetical protein